MTFATINVTLDELHLSEGNVRTNVEDATEVAALAASIASVGLIQPLVVAKRKGKAKGYDVIAGGRRLRALQQLVTEERRLAAEMLEVVLVDDPKKVTEISLAENYARKQMRPYEVYQAFAKIRAERPKATLEELGAMFGFDGSRTARIMRLANLSPTVMDAYASGAISDELAQAYAATEDHTLQDRVFQQLSAGPSYAHRPHDVRRAMKIDDDELGKLLLYVGREAYEAAGGRFEEDLFARDEGSGRILDEGLLQQLADAKQAEDRDLFEHRIKRNGRMLVADGAWGLADLQFSWADKPPTITQHGYTQTDYELLIRNPKAEPLDEETKARKEAMERRVAELDELLDQETPPEGHLQLAGEYDHLLDQLFDIEKRRAIVLPKKGKIVGVFSIERDGSTDIKLYYASRAEKGLSTPQGAKTKSAEKSPGEKERARWGLTKDGMQAMLMVRRDMIREQLLLTASGGTAIDFLIYTQARTILRPEKSYYGMRLDGAAQGIETPASQESGGNKPPSSVTKLYDTLSAAPNYRKALERLAKQPWVTAHDPVDGWMQFRAADQETKDEATAIVAGHGILASTGFYSDGRTPRMVAELANYLESEPEANAWADTATFDKAFFELISHKARLTLLEEWGVDAVLIKPLKKGDSAAFCARVIRACREDDDDARLLGISDMDRAEVSNWRPEWLDTHSVAPLPKPKAEERPAGPDEESEDEFEGDYEPEDEFADA
jgi:ParB family transcriptional regulator, chromosome partitioning protein